MSNENFSWSPGDSIYPNHHRRITKLTRPFSVEVISFSIFGLKFHLKMDIKELPVTSFKSGNDLHNNA